MSRQLEAHMEERGRRRATAILAAVEYDLAAAVRHAGAVFYGFAARCEPGECLLVIKGDLAGKRQVAFVGAEDLGGALIKAVRLGKTDKLNWKVDRYGT